MGPRIQNGSQVGIEVGHYELEPKLDVLEQGLRVFMGLPSQQTPAIKTGARSL